MKPAKPMLRRCTIYTRESSEEGLAQNFNSLHVQREASETFIRSQASEAGGWSRLITKMAGSRARAWSDRGSIKPCYTVRTPTERVACIFPTGSKSVIAKWFRGRHRGAQPRK
jgi:hypothetical protein